MNIIFDLDGTLLDSSERLYRLFQELVPESHLSKDQYWNLKRNQLSHQIILSRYFQGHDFNEFNLQWMKHIEDENYLMMDFVFDDTVYVLRYLSRKANIILLTARQYEKRLVSELQRLNIKDYFNMILTTASRYTKEELLRKCLFDGELIKGQNDIFVSDMGKDILLGQSLGYKTIAISHGFMNKEHLLKYYPDYIIGNLMEIIEYVVED